jgi:hypothetical protein
MSDFSENLTSEVAEDGGEVAEELEAAVDTFVSYHVYQSKPCYSVVTDPFLYDVVVIYFFDDGV